MSRIIKRLLSIALAMCCLLGCLVAQAEDCPFVWRIKRLNGSAGCLSDLPVARLVEPRSGRTVGDLVSRATAQYVVAASKSMECTAVSVGASSVGFTDYLQILQSRVVAECSAQGCECAPVIESGRVLSNRAERPFVPRKGLELAPGRLVSAYWQRAEGCPAPWIVTMPDGELGCLSSTPWIAASDRASGRPIGDLLKSMRSPYAIAAATTTGCSAAAVEGASSATEAVQDIVGRALAACMSTGCPCQAVVAGDRVLAREWSQGANAVATVPLTIVANSVPTGRPQSATPPTVTPSTSEAAPLAAAQQDVQLALPARRRLALVIGNWRYAHVAPLETAGADAVAMASTLEQFGFQVMKLFNLDERGMKTALRTFKNQLNPTDELVVYYAGHGVEIGGVNYLLPVDIHDESADQVRDESIDLQRFLDELRDRDVYFTLAIIDACRDNPFAGNARAISARGLTRATAAAGQMIVYSAGAGERALDRLSASDKSPNGLFARVLIQEIKRSDASVDRLMRIVRSEVARLARSVGRSQTPALYDQALNDFYFRRSSPGSTR